MSPLLRLQQAHGWQNLRADVGSRTRHTYHHIGTLRVGQDRNGERVWVGDQETFPPVSGLVRIDASSSSQRAIQIGRSDLAEDQSKWDIRNEDVGGGADLRIRAVDDEGRTQTHVLDLQRDGDVIVRNGNLAIGTGNPSTCATDARLCVAGDIYSRAVLLTSDARLKNEVKTIEHAAEKVAGLRGVAFEWREDGTREHESGQHAQLGVVAQEVERVFPELVNTNAEGVKTVSYLGLIAPLIEAVKAQQQQIDALERRLQESDSPTAP